MVISQSPGGGEARKGSTITIAIGVAATTTTPSTSTPSTPTTATPTG